MKKSLLCVVLTAALAGCGPEAPPDASDNTGSAEQALGLLPPPPLFPFFIWNPPVIIKPPPDLTNHGNAVCPNLSAGTNEAGLSAAYQAPLKTNVAWGGSEQTRLYYVRSTAPLTDADRALWVDSGLRASGNLQAVPGMFYELCLIAYRSSSWVVVGRASLQTPAVPFIADLTARSPRDNEVELGWNVLVDTRYVELLRGTILVHESTKADYQLEEQVPARLGAKSVTTVVPAGVHPFELKVTHQGNGGEYVQSLKASVTVSGSEYLGRQPRFLIYETQDHNPVACRATDITSTVPFACYSDGASWTQDQPCGTQKTSAASWHEYEEDCQRDLASQLNHLRCRTTLRAWYDASGRHEVFDWSNCAVDGAYSVPPIHDEVNQRSASTEFSIRYSFQCPGLNSLSFATIGGGGEFIYPGTNQLAAVVGFSDLILEDAYPLQTSARVFSAANDLQFAQNRCALAIHSVSKTPSADAIQQWATEAAYQASILRYALDYYLLLKDYQNLSTWNLTKLFLLRDRLVQLVAANPTVVHYKVLLSTVESAIAGQPTLYSQTEVDGALAATLQAARAKLTAEHQKALKIQDRFLTWLLAINAELAAVITEVGKVS